MRISIKAVLFFFSACLFSEMAFAQTEADRYVFLGFGIDEKVPGCVNNPSTRQESHWLPKNNNYEKAYDSLKAAVKGRYPGRFSRISQFTVRAGQPRVVAIIEKTWKCGGKNLSFYDGKNEAEITAKAESDKKMYSEIVSYRQVSLIDCQVEIAKLENKANTGISWNNATQANYEGVTAKYLYVSKTSKPFTFARFTNTQTDVIAKITFTLPGNKTITERLEPGWSLTRKIEAASFTVDVTYLPYKPGDTSESVLEWTKKKVRDVITDEGGKPKSTMTGIGVRG